jgi:hypothetical protein
MQFPLHKKQQKKHTVCAAAPTEKKHSKTKKLDKKEVLLSIFGLLKHELTGIAVGSAVATVAAAGYVARKIPLGSTSKAFEAINLAGKEVTVAPEVYAGLSVAAMAANVYFTYKLCKRLLPKVIRSQPATRKESFATKASKAVLRKVLHLPPPQNG